MPETGYHFEGEIGTKIRIETDKDLAAALAVNIQLQDPTGTSATIAATAVAGDVGDSILEGVLPTLIAGTYIAQAFAEFSTPWEGLGRSAAFEVFAKYATPA